jgi:hypothetical protein
LYATTKAVIVGDAAGFNQVLQTKRGHYSVRGYDSRASDSIGSIYLGYDEDNPDYAAQANLANPAIANIGFAHAFDLAFDAGRAVLANILKASGGRAPISLVTGYIDNVLAVLCRKYFDVPDDKDAFIVQGSLDWRTPGLAENAERKPHCPGDYYSPSRYMFDPTPSTAGEQYGKIHGRALYEATKSMKESGQPFEGEISRVLAERFPNSDLFSRTHVGVMMGFLPTITGSLFGILDDWLTSGEFWRHQTSLLNFERAAQSADARQAAANEPWHARITRKFPSWRPQTSQPDGEQPKLLADLAQMGGFKPSYAQAAEVLDLPMKQAMQRRPAPDFIWRTANQKTKIGEFNVSKNQVVALSIYSTAQEVAEKERTNMPETGPDVFAIFGGNRKEAGHPQHACPGYEMAMGTMIGTLSALMMDGTISPLPGELLVDLSARAPLKP